jgi:hypothetical protein
LNLGDAVNVFLGLALAFGAVAALSSAVTEAIASFFKLRARTLVAGLKAILNDPQLTKLAEAILNHTAVNPRSPGNNVWKAVGDSVSVSYIPPRQFASALLDVIQNPPMQQPHPDLNTAIDNIGDPQIRMLLRGIHDRAAGDIEKIHREIADWFDGAMDRLSGSHKRRSQAISFFAALVLAGLLNVDAFYLLTTLWSHPEVVAHGIDSIKEIKPETSPGGALAILAKDFPLGWPAPSVDLLHWGFRVSGWFATAFAALFGAPFWFDLIQQVAQIRSTGPAPKPLEASAS